MSTVPREQEIHTVGRGKSHMKRIGGSFRRKRGSTKDLLGKCSRLARNTKNGKTFHEGKPRFRGLTIAPTDLEQYEFRDVQLKTVSVTFPPLACNLLVS